MMPSALPIAALPQRWHQYSTLRASPRAQCAGCHRSARVCVCDALPSPPLMPQIPLLLLQHRREATRKLNSGALLQLAVSPTRLATVVARSIHSARQSSAWARYVEGEGRTPLLLYPCASALSVADVRERMRAGHDYFLIAIDGTWTEAKEILFSHSSINAEKDMVLPECLALTPADLAGHPGPLFAGCRKPTGPSSLCTLEAVARQTM